MFPRPREFLRVPRQSCWRSHEGAARRRAVREAREGSGRLLDAAGHSQRVVAQRGGDGHVGELGVEVLKVGGAALENRGTRITNVIGGKNILLDTISYFQTS